MKIPCSAAGLILCDFLRSAWFAYQTDTACAQAVKLCVLPFLLKDVGSLVLAGWLGARLLRALPLLSAREMR